MYGFVSFQHATLWEANYQRQIIHSSHAVFNGTHKVNQNFSAYLLMMYTSMCRFIAWSDIYNFGDAQHFKEYNLIKGSGKQQSRSLPESTCYAKNQNRYWMYGVN